MDCDFHLCLGLFIPIFLLSVDWVLQENVLTLT
jgi:hypothetical protein